MKAEVHATSTALAAQALLATKYPVGAIVPPLFAQTNLTTPAATVASAASLGSEPVPVVPNGTLLSRKCRKYLGEFYGLYK